MELSERIVLGGGCFWCLEAVFTRVVGIEAILPGYMGGSSSDANYTSVCSGTTRHVEVVEIVFNRDIIDLKRILQIFFTIHDPTSMDRQGADVGYQYKSIIFTNNDEQSSISNECIDELSASAVWGGPIVTEVRSAETFYVAENYHHQYYESNRLQPYCSYVIDPKLNALRNSWAKYLN